MIKEVKGYEGLYVAHSGGYIISVARKQNKYKEKIMKTTNGRYPLVCLCKHGKKTVKSVHRIIAEAFIPNPDHKPEVNHINGIRTDNRVENLEWATASENHIHAHSKGLKDGSNKNRIEASRLAKVRDRKLSNLTVLSIREEYKPRVVTASMLAEKYGISKQMVMSIVSFRSYKDVLLEGGE